MYTEIVGLDGYVTVHAGNNEKILKAGDKIQVIVNGNVVTQLGTRVTFDMVMDPSVYIAFETCHVIGSSFQFIQNHEHKLTILFDSIPASTTPTPIEIIFQAVVQPNFDGIMPMSNKATLTINDFTVFLPEVTPTLAIAGKGGVMLNDDDHHRRDVRDVKMKMKGSGGSGDVVIVGVVVLVACVVLGLMIVSAVMTRKKSPERYE